MARNVPQVAQGLPRGLCEGLARFKLPDGGSSLRVLLSRCHRPLYVRPRAP